MQSRILAFSGSKQSGKSTCSNFLHGYQLKSQGIVDDFSILSTGELVVNTGIVDETGEEEQGEAILDTSRTDFEFAEWAMYSLWPFVKKYSFAAPLKEISQGLFGLTHDQCHGTDYQKNTLTNIRWSDLPKVRNSPRMDYPVPSTKPKGKKMTAREFLQYFGTDICRSIYEDVWVDRCIADITFEQPLLAIVDDCRFPNEADAIQKAGGKVVRLTRSLHEDSHKSESALDDWDNFDTVIDNQEMDILETAKSLISTLDEWGWLGKEVTAEEAKAQWEPKPPESNITEPLLGRGIHTIKEDNK
tara:strand:+ start:924 stop:1829 length:906 start_codon:yes stop_codon:yes gene_type:complete